MEDLEDEDTVASEEWDDWLKLLEDETEPKGLNVTHATILRNEYRKMGRYNVKKFMDHGPTRTGLAQSIRLDLYMSAFCC